MKQRIFNFIILDESGSMQCIKSQVVSGVNETLQTIKGAQRQYEEQEHLVTFVSFNELSYNGKEAIVKVHYKCTPAELVREINSNDYTPNGNTPLYDAMGITLTELSTMVADDDKVLVTIITDGYENASREYAGAAIARLVGDLRKRGWVFTYIGANQDVEKVAESMNIKHRMAFGASPEDTQRMFLKEKFARARYCRQVDERLYDDDADFFAEDATEESVKNTVDNATIPPKKGWFGKLFGK